MRKATLDVRLGRIPLAAFAAGFVEKSWSSRQSLLLDGLARHITKVDCSKKLNIILHPPQRQIAIGKGYLVNKRAKMRPMKAKVGDPKKRSLNTIETSD